MQELLFPLTHPLDVHPPPSATSSSVSYEGSMASLLEHLREGLRRRYPFYCLMWSWGNTHILIPALNRAKVVTGWMGRDQVRSFQLSQSLELAKNIHLQLPFITFASQL